MEDFHGGLTMGSFDFPEQDEDEDEDYAFQNGAAERDLAREPYEWVWEKEGETGPDVHDGSDQPVKRTTYPRGKNPTTQAAAEPVATGSRLLQPEPVQPAGFEFVGSTVKVCAQQVQPAGFVFVGSALDMLCADSGGRRPAPAAKRPVRGQQDRGQGQRGAGRERGGKRGQAPGARGKGQETALSFS